MTKMRDGTDGARDGTDGAQLGCFAFSVFHRSTVSDTEKGDEGRSERGWTKCEGSGGF